MTNPADLTLADVVAWIRKQLCALIVGLPGSLILNRGAEAMFPNETVFIHLTVFLIGAASIGFCCQILWRDDD